MLIYWLWLTTRKGLRRQAIRKLLAYFDTPEDAYRAPETEYRLAGLEEKDLRPLQEKSLVEPRRILELCARKNIHILTCQDAGYPVRLANIPDPPVVLYYTGVLPDVDGEPAIAVIGSRKSSAYGLTCAKRLGYQIVACGGMVVSGMAAGGDAMAMTGAISAGGKVVGVLGCGVDVIYPSENKNLYAQIKEQGAIISEFLLGTEAQSSNFPRRNRIVSALSLGTLVVEATLHSGSLITARLAAEQGKDVFAIPGSPQDARALGPNKLIKDGAVLVENVDDILQVLALNNHKQITQYVDKCQKNVDIPESLMQDVCPSANNGSLLDLINREGIYVDELIRISGLSPAEVSLKLLELEMAGRIERQPGNKVALIK